MKKMVTLALFLALLLITGGYSQTVILEPPRGYTSGRTTPIIKLFYGSSDSVVLNWSKSLSGSARFRIGTSTGNYNFRELSVSGKRKAFIPSQAPLNLSTGRYYGRITNSSATTLSGIQADFNANPTTIDYSNEVQFVVESSTAPTPLEPQGNVTSGTPLFRWSSIAGVPAYWIIVSSTPFVVRTDSNNNISVSGANVTWDYISTTNSATYGQISPASPFTQSAIPLFPGNTYYYTILNLYDPSDVAFASTVFGGITSFTYQNNAVISAPNLIAPENNQTFEASPTIRFQWDAVQGANSYTIYLFNRVTQFAGSNQEIDVPIWNATTTNTLIDFPARVNLLRGKYVWFVVPNTNTGAGVSSPKRVFNYSIQMSKFRVQLKSSVDNSNLVNYNFYVNSTTGGFAPGLPYVVSNSQTLSDSLPSDSYQFRASKQGYFDSTFFVSVTGTTTNEITLYVRPFPSSVSGTVKDQSGAFVRDAVVQFTDILTNSVSNTTTTATGNFAISLPKSSYRVNVSKPGYLSPAQTTISVDTGQVILSTAFILTLDNASISGVIKNDEGEAVQLAKVRATKGAIVQETNSDASGNYSFALTSGTWTVEVSKTGFVSPPAKTITLSSGQNSQNQNFILVPRANQVSGYVYRVLSGTGQTSTVPFAGVEVKATPASGQTITTTTGPLGQYSFSLKSGTYVISASATGYTPNTSTQITVTVGQTLNGVDFTMSPNPSSVSGVITQTGGALLGDATISNGTVSTLSLGTGNYQLSLPAGTHTLTVTKSGFITPATVTVSLTHGQSLSGINFQLSPNAATITGSVLSAGLPLANASVTAVSGTQSYTVTSDGNGQYQFNIQPGTWILQASKSGFEQSAPDTTVVGAGQVSGNRNFSLIQNTTLIKGTVRSGNSALNSATVTITEVSNTTNTFSTLTNVNGEYAISVEAGKTYSLRISQTGYSSFTQQLSSLSAGATVVVNATLSPNPTSIAGVTRNSQIQSVGSVKIYLYNANTGILIDSTISSTSGSYFLGLTAGSYKLKAVKPGYTSDSLSFTVNLGQVVSNLNLTVNENFATITGTVKNSSGVAIEGVLVSVLGSSGGGTSTTNQSGTYTVSGLTTGSYTIRFSKQGFADSLISSYTIQDGNNKILNIALTTLSGKISGTVKTSGGTAVAEASVIAVTSSGMQFTALTGADGAYEISGLSLGTYVVTVSRSGYSSSETINVILTSSTLNGTATFTALNPNVAKISGTIKDGSGNNLQGVNVSLSGNTGSGNGTTNLSGVFLISELSPGTYNLTAYKQGYGTFTNTYTLSDSLTVNITMNANTSKVTGTVKNQSGGLLSFSPTLKLVSGQDIQTTTTDNNGNFTFDNVAPNATYTLATEIFREGYGNDDTSFTIAPGVVTYGPVNLISVISKSKVSGNVGTPSASVLVRNTATQEEFTTVSGSDGSYEVAFLTNGTFSVQPQKAGFNFSPSTTSVTLGIEDSKTANFTASANAGSVSVKALDNTGKAVQNAIVSVVSSDTQYVYNSATNNTGEAIFTQIPALQYTLTVQKDGYTANPLQKTITITNNGNLTENVTLTPNSSSVSGKVVAGTGTGLLGATVKLRNLSTGISSTALTASDGSYLFNQLSGGSLKLIATLTGYISDTLDISLNNGEIKTGQNLTIVRSSASLKGKVLYAGTGVSGLTARAVSSTTLEVKTNTSGQFEFTDLPINPSADTTVYNLTISGSSIVPISQIVKITPAQSGQTIQLNNIILPSGKVTVSINDGVAALAGVDIKFVRPDGNVISDVTGSNGQFNSSANLSAGRYKINMLKDEYLVPNEALTVIDLPNDTTTVSRTVSLKYKHTPVASIEASSSAPVVVSFKGNTTGAAATLFYKQGTGEFISVSMTKGTSSFTASIPALFSLSDVSYYIKVTEPGNIVFTTPVTTLKPGAKGLLSSVEFEPAISNVNLRVGDSYLIKAKTKDGLNLSLDTAFAGSAPSGKLKWTLNNNALSISYPDPLDSSQVLLSASAPGAYKVTVTATLRGTVVNQTSDVVVTSGVLKKITVNSPVPLLNNKSGGIQINYTGEDTSSKVIILGSSLQWSLNPPQAGTITSSGFFKPVDSTFIGTVTIIAKDSVAGKSGSVDVTVYADVVPGIAKLLTDKQGMSISLPSNAVNVPIRLTLSKPLFGPGKKNYSPPTGKTSYVVSDKQYFIIYDADQALPGDSLQKAAELILPIDNSLKLFGGQKSIGYYDINFNSWNPLTSNAVTTLGKSESEMDEANIEVDGLSYKGMTQFGEYSVLVTNEPLGIKYAAVLPNPFSPEVAPVKIGYFLNCIQPPASVTIKIYNMRGELVRTLLQNDLQMPGRYGSRTGIKEITWDGYNDDGMLALNGRYVVVITAKDPGGEVSEKIPLVLIK